MAVVTSTLTRQVSCGGGIEGATSCDRKTLRKNVLQVHSLHHRTSLLQQRPPALTQRRRVHEQAGHAIATKTLWRLSSTRNALPVFCSVSSTLDGGEGHGETEEPKTFGRGWRVGFTKGNELFVSRVAMLGFLASLVGEAITGQGTLSQLNLETGIPLCDAEPLLLFFILFTLVEGVRGLGDKASLLPPDSIMGNESANSSGLRSRLGLTEEGPFFGFTTRNELFVGRLAQLGFAASLIGEIITGKGILSQLNLETGLPVVDLEPILVLSVMIFFLAGINPETGRFFVDKDRKD